jgi:hypothetical protein
MSKYYDFDLLVQHDVFIVIKTNRYLFGLFYSILSDCIDWSALFYHCESVLATPQSILYLMEFDPLNVFKLLKLFSNINGHLLFCGIFQLFIYILPYLPGESQNR